MSANIRDVQIVRETRSDLVDGEKSYELTVRIRTNTPETDQQIIEDAVPFAIGDPYVYGSYTDEEARLVSASPRRVGRLEWHVSLRFEAVGVTDPTGTATTQSGQYPFPNVPIDRVEDFVNVDYRTVDEVIYRAKFIGHVGADGQPKHINHDILPPNTILPVQMSNGVPLNPPLQRPRFHPAIIVTSYHPNRMWDVTMRAVGKINSQPVRIRTFLQSSPGFEQFNNVFQFRQLWLVDEKWSPYTWGNVCVREFLYNPNGWYVDELDRGILKWNKPINSQSDPRFALYGNKPPYERILDPNGNPIHDPVPLDGKGQPLLTDDPDRAVFLRYMTEEEFDFRTLLGPFSTP